MSKHRGTQRPTCECQDVNCVWHPGSTRCKAIQRMVRHGNSMFCLGCASVKYRVKQPKMGEGPNLFETKGRFYPRVERKRK